MPTENRSSNTEMVSLPPYIGLEPLVGRYYPAQCRRCGWVGSSEELTEDDAQCTRDIGDRLCLGDCDELERHDLLNIIQAMAAPQPHPEPIAWMVGTAFWWTKEEAERDAAAMGLPVVTVGPCADPGEVERLREHVSAYEASRERLHGWLREEKLKNIALRAQMEEARRLLHTASIRLANWLEPGDDPRKQIIAFLEGGAEPGTPPAQYPNRLCHIDYTAHPYRCGCLKGDEEAQRRYDEHCRKACPVLGEHATAEVKP